MASDSRLTMNNTDSSGPQTIVSVGVSQSDSNYKTFLGNGRVGISTFDAATIKGIPISGYIESFLTEKVADNPDLEDVPQLLVEYFQTTPEVPDADFMSPDIRRSATRWNKESGGALPQAARFKTSSLLLKRAALCGMVRAMYSPE